MPSAIADTGPILHLREIAHLDCLQIFDHLLIPALVNQELRELQINLADLKIDFAISEIAEAEWKTVISESGTPIIHPADAQVFALARAHLFRVLVLTDDLALRRHLENAGATVVGTIGILVRAYSTKRLERSDLENAIEALFTKSTLHASRAFKTYVIQLIADL